MDSRSDAANDPRPDPLYVTIRDALARVGIGRTSLGEAMRSGLVRGRRLGKRVLVEVASLDAWVGNLPAY